MHSDQERGNNSDVSGETLHAEQVHESVLGDVEPQQEVSRQQRDDHDFSVLYDNGCFRVVSVQCKEQRKQKAQ